MFDEVVCGFDWTHPEPLTSAVTSETLVFTATQVSVANNALVADSKEIPSRCRAAAHLFRSSDTKDYCMSKNTGRGFRRGAVRGRSQTWNPMTRLWVKRDDATGRFMDGKTTGGRFKGVRKEK